jgi:NADH dehydrogenase [ubiquinone] 1 alpha subcomplex assembly factor 5
MKPHIPTVSQSSEHDSRIFDRELVRVHRDRAAHNFHHHNFLVSEIAQRCAERLTAVNRTFERVLDLGCHCGELAQALRERKDITTLVQADLSEKMVRKAQGIRVVADEEALPFAENSFDLVISALSLHWVNDLPGTLIQINRCLKPDGLFLGTFLGGQTLHELRAALLHGEIDAEGGASPRVSPFAEIRDAGSLLQRAGFALPVADIETITVTYTDTLALMKELRGMGETNALVNRRQKSTSRMTFAAAAHNYTEQYADQDGRIPAPFEILTLTGWCPDPGQQKPLKPGSANARLADALNTQELGAGDTTGSKS